MEFIKPRKRQGRKVNWVISARTRAIVKYYAEYTEYPEDEVVDMFLVKLLEDTQFMNWVHAKRNNKRILAQIKPPQEKEEQSVG